MLPDPRHILQRIAGLIAPVLCCMPLFVHAQEQYHGGIGRGTVQSASIRPLDCLNVLGGDALPGTACDDEEVCTINDVYSANCECAGTFQDTDGDEVCDAEDPCPTLADLENGDVCDDGEDCTVNDMVSGCVCAGSSLDTDGDGVCDADDACPLLANVVPESPCDDGSDCTTSDMYTSNCECLGTIITEVDPADIVGSWLLADGLAYTYTTTPVPGAEFDWQIGPNPGSWTLVEQEETVSVIAPPINDDAILCVSVTMGSVCLKYGCKDLFIMDVGVQEPLVAHSDYSVRPNPSEGLFELVKNGPDSGPVRFRVDDALGRSVLVSGSATASKTLIDLGSAVPGFYLLRVQHDQGMDVIRLVVR